MSNGRRRNRRAPERDTSHVPDLAQALRRSAELKEDLVAFGESRSFERFLLQHRLPDGTTVADRFVTRRTSLTDADRQMVLAWRDPVEGIFEVRGKDGDCPRAAASEIAAAALDLATSRPHLVFRNPEKAEEGWRSMREDRAAFADFFGSDELVLTVGEAEERINAYYRHRQQAATAAQRPGRARGNQHATPEVPLFTLPAELADAESACR